MSSPFTSSPFIGSEALRAGRLTRGQLRWNYTAIHPDVYVDKHCERTLEVNIRAASLWVPDGIVAGRAAAALYGVGWVDADTPVEVIGRSRRPRPGVVVREERIRADEYTTADGMCVSTPVRTALDLARHLPRSRAMTHLDALAAVTGIEPAAVLALARRYPGARGVRRARAILPMIDAGAQSPRESWLRMVLVDAGLPRPQTQIRVSDGYQTAFIDMGWEELRIGVEYNGDHHRSDRHQFVKDIGRYEMLSGLGWQIIRVVKEHGRAYIVERVREAFCRRGAPLAKSA
jgi:very-short-patch-repair endonuclease